MIRKLFCDVTQKPMYLNHEVFLKSYTQGRNLRNDNILSGYFTVDCSNKYSRYETSPLRGWLRQNTLKGPCI